MCHSSEVSPQGRDDTQPERQRYLGKSCDRRFDDLTGTILAGHHQPLRVWILCLSLMGLTRSKHHMAQELDLNKEELHQMTSQLRQGMIAQKPPPTLPDAVAWDEVSSVAGPKGQPEEVAKKGGAAGAGASKAIAAEGHLKPRSHRSLA